MSKIKNRTSLLGKLRRLSNVGQDDEVGREMEVLAEGAARQARRRIRSESGKLARSTGSSKAERKGDTVKVKIYSGNDEAFYAWFVENGHVNAPAHPYFFPSVRPVMAKASRAVGKRYSLQIREAVRK